MERKGTMHSKDTNLNKRAEEKDKGELRTEWMQTSASGASGGLETDECAVSLHVL